MIRLRCLTNAYIEFPFGPQGEVSPIGGVSLPIERIQGKPIASARATV
jgi:hypothetical protein